MSREAFEAACKKRWAGDRGALTIRADGEYENGHVQFAWWAWQAARAAALEEAAAACEAEADLWEGVEARLCAARIRALKEK